MWSEGTDCSPMQSKSRRKCPLTGRLGTENLDKTNGVLRTEIAKSFDVYKKDEKKDNLESSEVYKINTMETNLESNLLDSPTVETNVNDRGVVRNFDSLNFGNNLAKTIVQRVVYKRPVKQHTITKRRIVI